MRQISLLFRPPVQRQGADQYLLIALLSFAIAETLIRFFLTITGYPQLSGGELHIAHVIWGGLILFASSLFPLILANRWVYTLGALLSGIGAALFMDEIGKFITRSNDYFYPFAAPIIYAFFLLTILLYLRVRRRLPRHPRLELYHVLEALEEVIEHDLEPQEYERLKERLNYIATQTTQPNLAPVARELLDLLGTTTLIPERMDVMERLSAALRRIENTWLTRKRVKTVLLAGLLTLGILASLHILNIVQLFSGSTTMEQDIHTLFLTGQISSLGGFRWFLTRLVLETTFGLMILTSAVLLSSGRENTGVKLGTAALLLSLCVINLLVFYFDQFSTIIFAGFQFANYLGLRYFQRRYLLSLQPSTQALSLEG